MHDSYVVYCCRPTSVHMALIKNKQKFITLAMKVVERFVKKLKQLKVRASFTYARSSKLFHTLTLCNRMLRISLNNIKK